jgi:flagellar biosynthetic protein FliR
LNDGLALIYAHVPAFLLVLFRLGGIFIFGPVFGSQVIPIRVKVLIALVLAVCIYPIVPPQVPVELSLPTLGVAVGTEMLIGLIIGYGASLPLIAMQVGGQMMGHQLGLGLAHVFSPDFNEQTEVMSQFLFLMALAAFLVLGGHHAMISALVGSFHAVPLGGYLPDAALLELVTGLLQSMFELGLRVAAPLLCLVFLETVAMGFVARTVPQMNILSLGFPVRIIVGFFVLVATIAAMWTEASQGIVRMMRAVAQLFAV